ncbi:ubiquitin-like-specific protease ESD4 [Olea europaea subsp. europaea]|uniref:Ubiquitin-like-specific protease ESD4 n=1 Tax=Olea europaea subsp. europaea TaxID=158383 RepID=A0A8S0TD26_OLEEU|nr:ubiquitin-like-specific protease ESD4 [Olea europaea subsp. europaea]
MGALTVNRNRGNDYFKTPAPTSPSFDRSYAHVSKKLKLSNSMIGNTVDYGRPISAKSVNSRISEYPDSKPRFMREVHAPVRSHRFGVSASKNKIVSSLSLEENSEVRMGSMYGTLKYRLEKAKISAMKTFRYVGKENESVEKEKEKEVIEIDDKKESQDDMSEDLSVQEVEVVDSPRIKWKEGNGVLGNSRELKGKMVESNLQSLGSCVVSDTSGVNVKVDSTENMMDLVLMNQEADLSGVPVHRKLYDSAKKRNDKLESLSFAIELEEKSFQRLQLFRPQKKVEETNKHVSKECFMPITMEEEAEVANALSNSYRRKVLVSHKNSNIDITGEILQCLKPGAWLNDEVINLYLELLKEREKREPQKFLKCHFFNTFFYKKLISGRGGYNFQSVRRWTTQKKLGYSLLECDKIFVPIHKEVHWCLAIINKKDQKFQYLDSLKGVDAKAMKVLAKYLVDEVKDKSGMDIDVNSWEQEYVVNLPEQENGFDCGMFMIKYVDFYSRDIGLCFNQDHMSYFRQRTVKEILHMKAE